MTVVRTLGKNTLGDNNKMKVAMRDYDMSTHDISTMNSTIERQAKTLAEKAVKESSLYEVLQKAGIIK